MFFWVRVLLFLLLSGGRQSVILLLSGDRQSVFLLLFVCRLTDILLLSGDRRWTTKFCLFLSVQHIVKAAVIHH
jgi:hypothetical protein